MRRLIPTFVPVVLLMATGAGLAAKAKPKPKPKLVTVYGQAMLDKKPMVGAKVSIAGYKPVKTDRQGKFTVRIRPGNYTPVVTYKGKSYSQGQNTFGGYSPQHLYLWYTPEDEIKNKEAGIAPASLSYLLTLKYLCATILSEGSFLAVIVLTVFNI